MNTHKILPFCDGFMVMNRLHTNLMKKERFSLSFYGSNVISTVTFAETAGSKYR